MAGPLRGRGKKRAGPLRKKELILKFCCYFEIVGRKKDVILRLKKVSTAIKKITFYFLRLPLDNKITPPSPPPPENTDPM